MIQYCTDKDFGLKNLNTESQYSPDQLILVDKDKNLTETMDTQTTSNRAYFILKQL